VTDHLQRQSAAHALSWRYWRAGGNCSLGAAIQSVGRKSLRSTGELGRDITRSCVMSHWALQKDLRRSLCATPIMWRSNWGPSHKYAGCRIDGVEVVAHETIIL
jgi:hypothetical protein